MVIRSACVSRADLFASVQDGGQSQADLNVFVQDGGQIQADPTPTLLLLVLCFPYLCHVLTYSARSLFSSRHWPSLRMTLVVSVAPSAASRQSCH